jgi:hypothetical protein
MIAAALGGLVLKVTHVGDASFGLGIAVVGDFTCVIVIANGLIDAPAPPIVAALALGAVIVAVARELVWRAETNAGCHQLSRAQHRRECCDNGSLAPH